MSHLHTVEMHFESSDLITHDRGVVSLCQCGFRYYVRRASPRKMGPHAYAIALTPALDRGAAEYKDPQARSYNTSTPHSICSIKLHHSQVSISQTTVDTYYPSSIQTYVRS